MPRDTAPDPLFRTPADQINQVEQFKRDSNTVRGTLFEEYRNAAEDVTEAAEQLSKSHGIYLEYNRAKTGREKDWMFMIRITVPGGGAFNAKQWAIIDRCADQYCNNNPHGGSSIRLTTRQNIQFHWVKKPAMLALIQDIASTGFFTLNGCGDNTRNVMACPLSRFSNLYNAHAKAHEYGRYFQLPVAPHIEVFAIDPNFVPGDDSGKYDYGPQLLNRKFKIAFSSLIRDEDGNLIGDNCVELRTNDLGLAPIVGPGSDQVVAYQAYIGGGQGEKNGKSTFATLGQPVAIFTEENLQKGLHDIVKVHEEWGDRKNRHWARLKYVVHKQGIAWYQDQLRERGAVFELPNPELDYGIRMMHHGWTRQESNGLWTYGAYVECGRLVDSTDADADPNHQSGNVTGNGNLKTMVREALEAFPGVEVMISPNQDLLFNNIHGDAREDFLHKLNQYGFGRRKGKTYSTLRVLSGACVGLPTCRLSYTDSEQFEPELMDQLDAMGYGHMHESIGITGCERQCFRPATKTLGWVGQGPNMYMLKLGGSEDGKTQGTPLVRDGKLYLRQVMRDDVARVTAALFDFYNENKREGESMGQYHRRVGGDAVLDYLATREDIKHVLEKTAPAPYLPDGVMSVEAPVA